MPLPAEVPVGAELRPQSYTRVSTCASCSGNGVCLVQLSRSVCCPQHEAAGAFRATAPHSRSADQGQMNRILIVEQRQVR